MQLGLLKKGLDEFIWIAKWVTLTISLLIMDLLIYLFRVEGLLSVVSRNMSLATDSIVFWLLRKLQSISLI